MAGAAARHAPRGLMPTVALMVSEALTDAPMTCEALHARIAAAYGEAAPSKQSVQSVMCAKGEKLARKIKLGAKRVAWVRLDSTQTDEDLIAATAASMGAQAGSAKRVKGDGAAEGVPKPKRAKTAAEQVEARDAFQRKCDELLAKPFSAFALFGFAQRVTLKRQKPNASVRELVKAIGERWLLLGEAQQREYEVMAEEDRKRAESEASAREAAAAIDAAAM